jgi:transcriptional regulator GlxA family with amidase domain
MRSVAILAFDDCLASSVTAVTDVLTIANQLWQRRNPEAAELFSCKLVSADGRPVTTSCGIRMEVDGGPPRKPADVVFVPGLHYRNDGSLMSRVGAIASANRSWLLRHDRSGAWLATGCSGAFVFARLGLLDGKRATTSWWLAEFFRQQFPDVELQTEELVVRDGRMLSAGPANAHFNLALRIVEESVGRALARATAKVMLIDANRHSQLPYVVLRSELKHGDELVERAQGWMREHMRAGFSMREVARAVGTSPRNLIRRFKQAEGRTPLDYLQELRVETAKQLLETTKLDLDRIVERVGYRDASSFRRLFREQTTLSPREYRRRFAAPS